MMYSVSSLRHKTSRPSNVSETRSSMNSPSTTSRASSRSSALRSLLSFYFQKLQQHFSNPQSFILSSSSSLFHFLLSFSLDFFFRFLFLDCIDVNEEKHFVPIPQHPDRVQFQKPTHYAKIL